MKTSTDPLSHLLPILLLLPLTLAGTPSQSIDPVDGASSSVSQAAPSTSANAGNGGTYDQLIISSRDNLCLSVSGGNAAQATEGMKVQSLPCRSATTWNINRGQGSILLAANTSFALEFGVSPQDHGGLTLQKSQLNLPQQTWYFTNDNYIAVYNGTQCLDEGVNGAQMYTCQTNNGHQVWYVMDPEYAPEASMGYTYVSGIANLISTSSAAPSASSASLVNSASDAALSSTSGSVAAPSSSGQ